MKKIVVALICLASLLAGCAAEAKPAGQIYLYGEIHGVEAIYNRQLELWGGHYQRGLRHLFYEMPYFTAEWLNLWMQADNDDILDAVYADAEGTNAQNPYLFALYQAIKRDYPETVFHGTDVGHQYETTGARYLAYLAENDLANSPSYKLAQDNIAQGHTYQNGPGNNVDNVYRENAMAVNFIREFNALDGESVMGIYGAAHTRLDAMEYTTQSVPCMGNQLKVRYGEAVHSEDLKITAPERTDVITVAGKDYDAAYFGEYDLTGFQNYKSRAYWRLENAYDDFKSSPTTGDVQPADSYPMVVEAGQVYMVDYTTTDGVVTRVYYRADGDKWNGMPVTAEFTVE